MKQSKISWRSATRFLVLLTPLACLIAACTAIGDPKPRSLSAEFIQYCGPIKDYYGWNSTRADSLTDKCAQAMNELIRDDWATERQEICEHKSKVFELTYHSKYYYPYLGLKYARCAMYNKIAKACGSQSQQAAEGFRHKVQQSVSKPKFEDERPNQGIESVMGVCSS